MQNGPGRIPPGAVVVAERASLAAAPRRLAVLDAAAPRAGRLARTLDELLESLEVALHAAIDDAEGVTGGLDRALRLVLERQVDAGNVRAEFLERDDAPVRGAIDGLPRHDAVGLLVGDLRLPLLLPAGDLRLPAESGRIELDDLIDAFHEPREFLELCPLVVDSRDRHVDVDRIFDSGHVLASCV